MRTIVTISACVIALACVNAHARMYQWSHPSSGVVQLSGAPPAWYRGAVEGPRVLVFDNGQLIDDTAIAVGEPLRESLRAAAFMDADTPPAVNAADAQTRIPEIDAPLAADPERGEIGTAPEPPASDPENAPSPEVTVEQTVAELKSLLDAWDSRRRDEARSLLFGNDTPDGDSAP